MKKYNIEQLITKLNEYFNQGHKKLNEFENFFLDKDSIKIDNTNEKIKNVIYHNEFFEIILINWPYGVEKELKFHNHSENGELIKIIKGRGLEERILIKDKKTKYETILDYRENGMVYIDNEIGFHRLNNISNDILITLHIYAPAGFDCEYETIENIARLIK